MSQNAKPWDTRLVAFNESNKKELRWRESGNNLNVYLGVVKVIEECDFLVILLLFRMKVMMMNDTSCRAVTYCVS